VGCEGQPEEPLVLEQQGLRAAAGGGNYRAWTPCTPFLCRVRVGWARQQRLLLEVAVERGVKVLLQAVAVEPEQALAPVLVTRSRVLPAPRRFMSPFAVAADGATCMAQWRAEARPAALASGTRAAQPAMYPT